MSNPNPNLYRESVLYRNKCGCEVASSLAGTFWRYCQGHQIKSASRVELAALRKQRDFLLESNNRLVEERRTAEENMAKTYVLLERAQERWAAALDKLQECREQHDAETSA